MKSLQGHFLIASPHLPDPNFRRTVVLLVRHDEEGAFGLILNRPTQAHLADVWSKVADTPCNNDAILFLGGPVEGPLMAIHADPQLADMEILPGIYFSAQPAALESLAARSDDLVRFFVGYSGWGEGQLEAELTEGSWLTPPASAECILSPADELWERVTREIGKTKVLDALHIRHEPPDPSLN